MKEFYVYSVEENTAKRILKEVFVGSYETYEEAKDRAERRLEALSLGMKRSPFSMIKTHVEIRQVTVVSDSRKWRKLR